MAMITITHETADAGLPIEQLLDRTFGPQRHFKTAQRLRDGRLPAAGLAFTADDGRRIVGTIRFWHVRIGHGPDALLLGPMAVEPGLSGQGIGRALIARGLAEAARLGHRAVILVGDEPYYGRFGFAPGLTAQMSLPGPVQRPRFLARELAPQALWAGKGLVRPTGGLDPAWPLRLVAA